MKISRLYVKIFVSFMALLIVVQFFIFGLFKYIVTRSVERGVPLDEVDYIAILVADSVADRISANDPEFVQLENYTRLMETRLHTRIWIELDDRIIGEPLKIDIPPNGWMTRIKSRNYSLDVKFGKHSAYFIHIPFRKGTRSGIVHAYRDKDSERIIDHHFVLGLMLITGIAMLILIPVTRHVTTPLKKLTIAAHRISRGDFNHKLDVCSGAGEIGALSAAFELMRERVDRMLRGAKELAANVSHQIRSPLARMRVATEIMRERTARGDVQGAEDCLSTIEREIDEVDRLAGSIIALMKKDVSHRSEELHPVDLSAIGREIVDLYRGMIGLRKLVLEERLHDGPLIIQGVEDDVRALVEVLVDNAIKYTAPGGTIRISSERTEGRVSLSVFNSFAPLDDEMRENIFEPFARNSSEKIPGHGLGLAIARRIAVSHNGTLSARNVDGGIIFELLI